MNELVKLGVAAKRLEAEGYGDKHPAAVLRRMVDPKPEKWGHREHPVTHNLLYLLDYSCRKISDVCPVLGCLLYKNYTIIELGTLLAA
jgi:hypothetical protein